MTFAAPIAPITVLLVDDSPAVRQAVRWVLEEADELSVIGEACDGAEALRQAAELRPDVVILDIELPVRDGFAVARSLKAAASPPLVIFLSVHSAPAFRQRAAEAGGDAFAEKAWGGTLLIARIRQAITQRRHGAP